LLLYLYQRHISAICSAGRGEMKRGRGSEEEEESLVKNVKLMALMEERKVSSV
jgi:hypothetical protein